MKKLMLMLVMVFLLTGVVSAADRTLYDVSPSLNVPIGNVAAGSPFETSFNFRYLDNHVNPENSPLIVQLNFTSNDSNYPVWRNDFEVSGRVEKFALWGLIPLPSVYFECNNSETQTIEHPLDAQTVHTNNGTFYCYNPAGDLELEEHDDVYLDIKSHQAIYPGKYNLTASMFYLTDERAPFVNITNKNIFDVYYRELDNVEVWATIEDGSGISDRWGNIFANYDITVPFSHETLDTHYFTKILPIDILEGDYDLFIFAEDDYNNIGNDSVTLKIDRTAPDIVLIQPNGSIYTDMLPIEVNVSDMKSGLNVSDVKYRLREMDGNNTCPEDGVGTWTCYNSGWLSLPNISGDLFGVDVNTKEVGLNGEYWLEIRAYDILGNEGILE